MNVIVKALACAAVIAATPAAATNILDNPGLETGSLSPWYQNNDFSDGTNWFVTDADSHSGDFSAEDTGNKELRSEPVSRIASAISAYAGVRAALLERQQDFAGQPGGAVLDGRDIGTVIAPQADVKLFVTASPEVRAQRRVRELLERGMPAHYEDVLADIRSRDERDMGRAVAPLKQAPDAVLLDTSELDIDQSIAEAVRLVEEVVRA